MKRIAIVTDSAANVPPEIAEEYGISIIPLTVHWNGDTYLDGVTLDTATFYKWLQERKEFPTTSQPSVGAFIEFFRATAERTQTDTILGIFLTSKLSGTFSSAMQAKAELPELRIEIVDSQFVSMGIGFQVLAAARAAQEGTPLEAVVERVTQVRGRTELFIALETLDYLHRGGRIGNAAHMLGTMLSFKPLLNMEDGIIKAMGKTRSRTKSLQKMVEITEKRLGGRQPEELAIVQIGAEEDAAQLGEWLTARVKPKRLYTGVLCPALGVHGGPGAIGMAFYSEP